MFLLYPGQPGCMGCTAADRLVHIDVAVANFDIKAARWVSTHPRLEGYRSTLTAKIGKGNKVANLAMLALGKRYLRHGILPHSCHRTQNTVFGSRGYYTPVLDSAQRYLMMPPV